MPAARRETELQKAVADRHAFSEKVTYDESPGEALKTLDDGTEDVMHAAPIAEMKVLLLQQIQDALRTAKTATFADEKFIEAAPDA